MGDLNQLKKEDLVGLLEKARGGGRDGGAGQLRGEAPPVERKMNMEALKEVRCCNSPCLGNSASHVPRALGR